jgi:putative ABC transport system substrate-binding protein
VARPRAHRDPARRAVGVVIPAAAGVAEPMDRRCFLLTSLAGILATPIGVRAQQVARPHRLGILGNIPPSDVEGARVWGALSQGLRELGYVEGHNLAVLHLSTRGQAERRSALAAELVRWKPDVIVVPNNTNALAMREATRTIPIVAATFSETSGLITSLARPGGNVTGLTLLMPEMAGKQLQLLREMLPRVSRVALLWNPVNRSGQATLGEARTAARQLGLQLQVVEAKRPEDIDQAFTAMRGEQAEALVLVSDAMFILERSRIQHLATKANLPVMYTLREHISANGLAFYGPSMADNFRRSAVYVDKIFKGAKPADLPVERPTRFELIINLKTAKAIGLTIPPSVLARADQIIK